MLEEFVAIATSVLLVACLVTPALAQETGSISGRVFDNSNTRPLRGASVTVVGTESDAESDVDGYFTVKVPPGTYEVRVVAPTYGTSVIQKVTVEVGRETDIRIGLTPQTDAGVEIIDVSADVTEASEATQLMKRKMAPTVSDNLGAEGIARTPDSDAAEVVTRLPSITITDGSFIVVRGLSDRYNAALMNKGRLPSTDPERRVVPLDLFPADFIESLTVVKSYSPDLPGDFAGGLVDLNLADPPAEPQASIGTSLGFNTASTFQDFNTYNGCGASDWFGYGTHCRDLPDSMTPDLMRQVETDGTDRQIQALVAALPQNWGIDTTTAPPNFGIDGNLGNTWGPFGINLAGTYGTKHKVHRNEIANTRPQTAILEENTYDRSTFESNLGAVATSKYQINNDHRLNLRLLFNHSAEDEVLNATEPSSDKETAPSRERFPVSSAKYTEDQLIFGQLSSQDRLGPFDADTRIAAGYTTRNQPDGKFLMYRASEGEAPLPLLLNNNVSDSTLRYFMELDETLIDAATDFSLPLRSIESLADWFPTGTFKLGGAYLARDRDFKARIFDSRKGVIPGNGTTLDPDVLLAPSQYSKSFQFREVTTKETQRFLARQDVAAGYLMADVPLYSEKLRLIGGARLEYSYIFIEGVLPGNCPPIEGCSGDGIIRRPINSLDLLPSGALVYSIADSMSLRGGVSQTVSRPEFRELNPALIPTAPGDRPFRGNPGLESSEIVNFDLRWDWFLSPLELVSISFFYKQIDLPIEQTFIAATNTPETSVNAEKADLWGFEFETRKNFNFLVPTLREWEPLRPYASAAGDIELSLNATFVESEAEGFRPPLLFDTSLAANDPRPLTQQAPFVINTALQYQHFRWGTFRLLYNTIGETIVAAGIISEGSGVLDDIKRQRRDQLDFVWLREWGLESGSRLKAKLTVENITNDQYIELQDYTVTQPTETGITTLESGTSTLNRYVEGVTFNVGLTYSF